MELWEVTAREAIRDLVARYNTLGDAGRFDELLALFTDDAVLQTDDETATGSGELRGFFTRVAGPVPTYVRHFTATLTIDVATPTTATARSYYQVLTTDGLDHWGRYADDLVATADGWRFARRRVRLDGMRPKGWAAAYQQRRGHQAP